MKWEGDVVVAILRRPKDLAIRPKDTVICTRLGVRSPVVCEKDSRLSRVMVRDENIGAWWLR